MSMQNDFAPIGTLVSSSEGLEIDFQEQQFLAHQMNHTADQLRDVPDLVPFSSELSLDQAPARNSRGRLAPGSTIGLSYSETEAGLFNATIRLTEAGNSSTRLILKPAANMWEEWRPGEKEPSRIFTPNDLLVILEKRLKDPAAVGELMDSVDMEAMAIPHLLGQHLKAEAKRRTRVAEYRVDSRRAESQSPHFSGNVEAILRDRQVNRELTRSLSTSALFDLGRGIVVKKLYGYGVVSNSRGIRKAEGIVTMSSKDGLAKDQLAAFAATDQADNYPVDALHEALTAVRKAYNLYTEQSSAA